ncbi:Bardet-Biedl syndrome 1 N-terminal domain-containing protein [Plasmodiophora brassicae]
MSQPAAATLPREGHTGKDDDAGDDDVPLAKKQPAATAAAARIWLNAWDDPVANARLSRGCLQLVDLNGDGDYKAVVALQSRRLKVYRGKAALTEMALLDEPTAVEAFYADAATPLVPMLAIASGPLLYIYRNLRPFYKFQVPAVDPDPDESLIWDRLASGQLRPEAGASDLVALRQAGRTITPRSATLIGIGSDVSRAAFVESCRGKPLGYHAPITCMTTLNKSSEDARAVGSVVVGTEAGQVLILNQHGMKVVRQIDLGAAPAFLDASGLLDVTYRVVAACRNGRVYSIRNGKVIGGPIETETECCGVVLLVNHVLVGCMNNVFHGYHVKGNLLYTVRLPAPITCMAAFQLRRASNLSGAMVALANGDVRLYDGRALLTTVTCSAPVAAMKFGQYGREDASLFMVSTTGAITMKILQRQAQLDANQQQQQQQASSGPPAEQDEPLAIPKRTQLYVDQMNRERQQGPQMHMVFQRDLARLRLATAQAYAKVLAEGHGSVSSHLSLRLNAQVLGLGPRFLIRLAFRNTGPSALLDVPVCIMLDTQVYTIARPAFVVPAIVPGVNLHTDVAVRCIAPGTPDTRQVRVIVCRPSGDGGVPILNVVIVMPAVAV